MQVEDLRDLVVRTLDDMKAIDLTVIDVRGKTSITDFFVLASGTSDRHVVLASGTSDRHVKAMAETVMYQAKEHGERPLGAEGLNEGDWALVDLNGVVVHLMLPKVRDYYQLEKLWQHDVPKAEQLAKHRV